MAYSMRATDENVMIAEGAAVVGDVTLGKNVNIWYHAVLRGDEGAITVGDDTNIQECVILHKETHIGAGCTLGHSAVVHGCTVGDNTLIGMGSVILTGAVIGRDCIVGAGALVTGKTAAPDGVLLMGCPAKIVRNLTPGEIEENRESMRGYLELARRYRAGGKPAAKK